MTELITVPVAAALMGCSHATVKRLCAAGALPARKDGRDWLIEAAAATAYEPRDRVLKVRVPARQLRAIDQIAAADGTSRDTAVIRLLWWSIDTEIDTREDLPG